MSKLAKRATLPGIKKPRSQAFHLPANIQNDFGICGWILTILSYILIFFTLPISACMCIKVTAERFNFNQLQIICRSFKNMREQLSSDSVV